MISSKLIAMKNRAQIEQLVDHGIVPDDVEVIVHTNNLILRSKQSRIVARVAIDSSVSERDDPQNVIYSHRIAWEMAERGAPVLRPLSSEPILLQDMKVSLFPLADDVNWTEQNPSDVAGVLRDFSEWESTNLRTMNAPIYISERLTKVEAKSFRGNEKAFQAIASKFEDHQFSNPFERDANATVHGDVHSGNMVLFDGKLKFIDLDAVAKGTSHYDFGSWRLRHELFDTRLDVKAVIDEARRSSKWSEDNYRSMIGWKALSSLTYVLSYSEMSEVVGQVNTIGAAAHKLGGLKWQEI